MQCAADDTLCFDSHWVRRRAIHAPDDGRMDWFAGGADRATRVPAGF